ncbi:MAG: hypothetical protein ACW967_08475, partial [Candidatus Hodarchaeales archaeon]
VPSGTNYETSLNDLITTTNNGFAVLGLTHNISGSEDIFLLKVDPNGAVEWEKSYDGPEHKFDYPVKVLQLEDEGFLIAGGKGVTIGGSYDYWLIRTYANGSIQWDTSFNNAHDPPTNLIETNDGNFMITGATKESGELFKVWSIKVNENGEKIWDKFYEHEKSLDHSFGTSLVQTIDNGYAFLAFTWDEPWQGFVFSAEDYFLVKTDENGVKEWDLQYGGEFRDYPTTLLQTSEGDFLVSGTYSRKDWDNEPNTDMCLIKVSNSGKLLWEFTYGEDSKSDSIGNILLKGDNLYAVGYTESYGTQGGSIWFGKFSFTEDTTTTNSFPGFVSILISIPILVVLNRQFKKKSF